MVDKMVELAWGGRDSQDSSRLMILSFLDLVERMIIEIQ